MTQDKTRITRCVVALGSLWYTVIANVQSDTEQQDVEMLCQEKG